jgi:hypothetical protein
MLIRVLTECGLHHVPAGLRAWGPGEYEFPDDPRYRGWLDGMVARGLCVIVEPEPQGAGVEPEPQGAGVEPEPQGAGVEPEPKRTRRSRSSKR